MISGQECLKIKTKRRFTRRKEVRMKKREKLVALALTGSMLMSLTGYVGTIGAKASEEGEEAVCFLSADTGFRSSGRVLDVQVFDGSM